MKLALMLRKFLISIFLLKSSSGFTQTPEINSVLVNACSLSEGIDELVVFTNGNSNLNINNINISYPNGGSYCNSGCGTQTLLNNPAYVNSLNTLAGCTLFQYANPIPPNAKVVIFTGLNPSTVFDYSNECGNGPYYVIFSNNTSTVGRFSNGTSPISNRTLTINFNGVVESVTYTASSANVGDNGDYVSFTDNGVPTYNNIGTCAVPLPIELLSFIGKNIKDINSIKWITLTERNNSYFVLMRSLDGKSWEDIFTIFGAGNSTFQIEYEFDDLDFKDSINYYRLKQVDFDGDFTFSYIIAINNLAKNQDIIKRINIIGQDVNENTQGLIIEFYSDGTSRKILK